MLLIRLWPDKVKSHRAHLSHCSTQQSAVDISLASLLLFMFWPKLVWHGPQKVTTNSQISNPSDYWSILQHHSPHYSLKFMDELRNPSEQLCKKKKKTQASASFQVFYQSLRGFILFNVDVPHIRELMQGSSLLLGCSMGMFQCSVSTFGYQETWRTEIFME